MSFRRGGAVLNSNAGKRVRGTLLRIPLILYAVMVLVPFLMLLLNSFKTNAEFYENVWALPKRLSFANFIEAFRVADMGLYMWNSAVVTVAAVALNLALGAMVSYAIARRGLRSAKKLYNLYLLGLLIPQIIGIIPLFLMARIFHLFNTLSILILSYAAAELSFCVFTLVAFFKNLPGTLEEAATIDGAGDFQVFSRIMLPLARPGLITVGVFTFLGFWSEYTRALAFISSPEKRTIPLAILTFKPVSGFKVDWGLLCAACVIFIVPVIAVYGVFQRKLIGGLTTGSVKG